MGKVIRIPVYELEEGPKGIIIAGGNYNYDVELSDGYPFTCKRERLELATKMDILLYS